MQVNEGICSGHMIENIPMYKYVCHVNDVYHCTCTVYKYCEITINYQSQILYKCVCGLVVLYLPLAALTWVLVNHSSNHRQFENHYLPIKVKRVHLVCCHLSATEGGGPVWVAAAVILSYSIYSAVIAPPQNW